MEKGIIMKTVTVAQMKQIEHNAAQSGLSYTQMMENAGTEAAGFLTALQPSVHTITIFAGKGNNAGDGFVAARLLKVAGCNVTIVLSDGVVQTPDARLNLEKAKACGILVLDFAEETACIAEHLKSGTFIIDAIYGTGFHGILRPNMRLITKLINSSDCPVLSLDIPSGVNADSGEADPDAIRAAWTIVFDSLKPAHTLDSSALFCGKIVPVDIGIPEKCHEISE